MSSTCMLADARLVSRCNYLAAARLRCVCWLTLACLQSVNPKYVDIVVISLQNIICTDFLLLPSGAVRSKRSAALQGELEARLAEVVRAVNERKDHIPPVVSPATVTFPFEIAIAGCAAWSSA